MNPRKIVALSNRADIQAMTSFNLYLLEKMRFLTKGEKDSILFNSQITISNIPLEACEYTVNGKSAIEWVMERYQVTTDKDSGIRNDPNDWGGRYVLDLVLRVVRVSVETVRIVGTLPELTF